MQISSLIGTIILSPEGEKLGYVKGVLLTRDLKTLASLVAVDNEEEEFYLSARTVRSVKDAVIAGKARLTSPVGIPSPVGRAVYSQDGEFLGAVTDVIFSEETRICVTKNGEETQHTVSRVAVGETVIIYDGARPAQKRTSPRKPTASKKKKARAIPVEQQNASSLPAEQNTPQTAPRPNVFVFNRYNLLGRRVKKSVFDDYGVPVALAGDKITPAVLTLARKSNRLLALTVNTLTNIL